MAYDKNYPFPMWNPEVPLNDNPKKGELNPVYPNTKKQEDAFRSDGFTDVFANIEQKAYPRAMYNKDGVMKPATDAQHQKELEADGFGLKAVAKKPVPVPRHALDKVAAAVNDVAVDDGRIAELDDRIAGLEASLEEIRTEQEASKTALDQILEAVTKGKAAPPAPPEAPSTGKPTKEKAS